MHTPRSTHNIHCHPPWAQIVKYLTLLADLPAHRQQALWSRRSAPHRIRPRGSLARWLASSPLATSIGGAAQSIIIGPRHGKARHRQRKPPAGGCARSARRPRRPRRARPPLRPLMDRVTRGRGGGGRGSPGRAGLSAPRRGQAGRAGRAGLKGDIADPWHSPRYVCKVIGQGERSGRGVAQPSPR